MNSENKWRVVVANSAEKQLSRIPRRDAERIASAIEMSSEDPFIGDIVRLSGEENLWRRRIGSYRMFFEVFRNSQTVLIQDIRRRGSKTY